MVLSNIVAAIFLVFLFVDYVHSEAQLTPFGKQVQKNLPKDTFKKVFAVNADSPGQFLKAIQKATDDFDEILGADIAKPLQKQLVDEGKRLKDAVTPTLLLTVYANAIGKTLKDNGKLNSGNLKDLAQKYVDELIKSAKSLKSTNILSTLPALIVANANFLKSFGLTSTDNVNQFAKNLISEINKY